MRIEPYLFFEGRCDEAIAFYKGSLGGTVNMIMRYKDCPQGPPGGFPAVFSSQGYFTRKTK